MESPEVLDEGKPAHDMECVRSPQIVRRYSNSVTRENNGGGHSASAQLGFDSVAQKLVFGVQGLAVDVLVPQQVGWSIGESCALLDKARCQWPVLCASLALAGEAVPGFVKLTYDAHLHDWKTNLEEKWGEMTRPISKQLLSTIPHSVAKVASITLADLVRMIMTRMMRMIMTRMMRMIMMRMIMMRRGNLKP